MDPAAAMLCQLWHGTSTEPPEAKAARQGLGDLIGRTVKADRDELTRDERRLRARYERTLDAARAVAVDGHQRCPKCSSSAN